MKLKLKVGYNITRMLFYIFYILLFVVTIFPIWATLVNGTRSNIEINSGVTLIPSRYTVQNWNVIYDYGLKPLRSFANSLYIAITASFVTLYTSCMMAYALVVYDYKLRRFQNAFIIAVMMIPSGITIIGFYKMMYNIGWTNNHLAFILPGAATPACVYFIRQYIRGALPLELIAAARIDGSGEFYTFNVISLPILKPAIATQLVFCFIGSWNNWLLPSILISDVNLITMPVMVGLLRDCKYKQELGAQYLGLAVAIIPITVFYMIFSQQIISGISLGGLNE